MFIRKADFRNSSYFIHKQSTGAREEKTHELAGGFTDIGRNNAFLLLAARRGVPPRRSDIRP